VSALPPSFRPKGAGTGLGPMPHAETVAAVAAAVARCPQLPFWPTRPAAVAAERPDRLWALGLPGVAEAGGRLVWAGRSAAPGEPALPAEATVTLEPFLKALATRAAPGWCLLPARGPVTLALALDAGGRPALSVPSARGPFGLGYGARLRSLVNRVKEALPATRVLLLLDEPELDAELVAARPGLALELWRAVRGNGADLTGLRCQGAPPWPLVLDLDPDLVAFDAAGDAGGAATDDPAFRRLVQGGAAVAWGLVPATPGLPRPDADALAAGLLDLVEWTAGDYLPELLARSLVTPGGGLEALAPDQAEACLTLTAAVGRSAWAQAGLP
jgi:hypothetical protein